jgi:hypothetical protein
MATTTELLTTAQYLHNAAPEQFDRFRAEFRRYTAEAVKNLLNASTELPQLQGRAAQCSKLLDEVFDKVK